MKRQKVGAVDKVLQDPVIKYAAVGLAAFAVLKVFGAVDGILEAIGIKDSQDSVELDGQNTAVSYWSPNFYKSAPTGTWLLTSAAASQYAGELYDAFGGFNDNEEQAIGIFKRLRSQAQVSQLADVFFQKHKQDLLTFLRGGSWPQDRLSDTDVNIINNFIKTLPKYF